MFWAVLIADVSFTLILDISCHVFEGLTIFILNDMRSALAITIKRAINSYFKKQDSCRIFFIQHTDIFLRWVYYVLSEELMNVCVSAPRLYYPFSYHKNWSHTHSHRGIIQKKPVFGSRMLPLVIFDKKVPFFPKMVLF